MADGAMAIEFFAMVKEKKHKNKKHKSIHPSNAPPNYERFCEIPKSVLLNPKEKWSCASA
jgi:hypothetical protein